MSTFQFKNSKGVTARIVTSPKVVYKVTATHRGSAGKDGKSAYQLWLDAGNVGSTTDYQNSLRGTTGGDGKSAYQGWLDAGNTGDFSAFLLTLKGTKGDDGLQGYGVPTGGTSGQLLGKVSSAPNDTSWLDPPATGGGEVDPYVYQRGTSLSGMEFAETVLPGSAGTNYTIHRSLDFQYYGGKGLTIMRLAFLWERLQPILRGDLDPAYKALIDDCVSYAKSNGMKVILDPHNYGRYTDYTSGTTYVIGAADGVVKVSDFADFWRKVASAYKSETGVFMYDLMNEPHDMPIPLSALTANPDTSIVQLITNPSVEADYAGWTFDSADFTWSADKAWSGSHSIKQASATGYGSLTTPQGIPVTPNTDYVYSFYYQVQTAGNFDYETPNVAINTGDSFANGGVILASTQLNAISTVFLRKEITFNSGANNVVFIRHFNNNVSTTCYYDGFNLTPGTTAGTYTPKVGNGTVATVIEMNQAAINAIRSVDLNHWITMPLDRYSGIQQFTDQFGTSNPQKWWTDPINKTMLTFHYYFDLTHQGSYTDNAGDGNGVWSTALRTRIPGDILPAFQWAQNNGVKLYMGEYGVPNDASSDSANWRADMGTFLAYMDTYDVYGTQWAGGSWYGSITTLQPANAFYSDTDFSVDRAQMAVLTAHLSKEIGGGYTPPVTTKGDLFGFDTVANRIPVGTNGQVLMADSVSALGLKWATATGLTNPMTNIGDLIQGSTAGAPVALAAVATGNVLISGGVTTANSWGKVGLTTHVSGVLPVANGGTGSATQNFLDLTTAQTKSGVLTLTNTLNVSSDIKMANAKAYRGTSPSGTEIVFFKTSGGSGSVHFLSDITSSSVDNIHFAYNTSVGITFGVGRIKPLNLSFDSQSGVSLRYNGTERLALTDTGATVTGLLTTTSLKMGETTAGYVLTADAAGNYTPQAATGGSGTAIAESQVTNLVTDLAAKASLVYADSEVTKLANGFNICQRPNIRQTIIPASGEGFLYYFTAKTADIITKIQVNTSDAVAAGLTLARVGIYTVDASDNMTLVASTASSTVGYSAVYNAITTALSSSYTFIVGQRYSVMVLFVGTTPPKMVCASGSDDYGQNSNLPRLCGKVTALTDLPATQANTGVSATGVGINTLMLQT